MITEKWIGRWRLVNGKYGYRLFLDKSDGCVFWCKVDKEAVKIIHGKKVIIPKTMKKLNFRLGQIKTRAVVMVS